MRTRNHHIVPAYLDLPRLAEYSSLAVPTLRDHIRRGGLPHYKVGGKILVAKEEFDSWLKGFRVEREQELNRVVDGILEDLKGKGSAAQSEGHRG